MKTATKKNALPKKNAHKLRRAAAPVVAVKQGTTAKNRAFPAAAALADVQLAALAPVTVTGKIKLETSSMTYAQLEAQLNRVAVGMPATPTTGTATVSWPPKSDPIPIPPPFTTTPADSPVPWTGVTPVVPLSHRMSSSISTTPDASPPPATALPSQASPPTRSSTASRPPSPASTTPADASSPRAARSRGRLPQRDHAAQYRLHLLDGRQATVTDPANNTTGYTYNQRGQFATVTQQSSGGPVNTFNNYAWSGAGRLGYTWHSFGGNSANSDYAYDAAGEVLSISHKAGGNSFDISAYGYDSRGRRQYIQRLGGLGDVYSYDAGNQVDTTSYNATNPPAGNAGEFCREQATGLVDAAGLA